jgi:hypothetical protein
MAMRPAQRAYPGVAVVPIVAVHGAQVPRGKVVVNGVPVVPARHLPSMLRQLPAVLGPERVAGLANQARIRFHAAAEPATNAGLKRCDRTPLAPFLPNRMRTWGAVGAASCRPWSWRDRGCAFGASCFAGKLRTLAGLALVSRGRGGLDPTLVPTRSGCVPPLGSRGGFMLVMPLRGSGAAAPQGALRAIDPSARPRSWRTLRPAPPAAAISA